MYNIYGSTINFDYDTQGRSHGGCFWVSKQPSTEIFFYFLGFLGKNPKTHTKFLLLHVKITGYTSDDTFL